MTSPHAMNYGAALVRILPSCRVLDFLNGSLFLNTAAYFGKIEKSDQVRFDSHDGVDEAIQAAKLDILADSGEWIDINGFINPITTRRAESAALNILCFYTMTDRKNDSFDERNLEFGDTAVFIRDLLEFLKRVRHAAERQNKRVEVNPITYVERRSYHGPMGQFRKFSEHSYQNESRIVIDGGNGAACRLEVGDIRDITYTLPSICVPRVWAKMRGEGALQ